MIYHGGVSVLAEDDNTMDAADKALINDFIWMKAYRDYEPGIAGSCQKTYQHLCGTHTVPVNLSGYYLTC